MIRGKESYYYYPILGVVTLGGGKEGDVCLFSEVEAGGHLLVGAGRRGKQPKARGDVVSDQSDQ